MTERNPNVVVTSDETLSDIVDRLREAADGGRTVDLVVPIDSALLLTAREFRTLKEAIDEDRRGADAHRRSRSVSSSPRRVGIRAEALPDRGRCVPAAAPAGD